MQSSTDVQDLPSVLLQLSERRATDIERALQIDVHDRAKAVRRKLLRRAKKISGRAVDDNIYTAKPFDSRGDCLLNFLGFAHVGGDGKGFTDARALFFRTLPDSRANAARAAPCVINRFRSRFKMFEAATNKRHVRARFRQRARDAAGDASAAAGYEGDVGIQDPFSKDFVHGD